VVTEAEWNTLSKFYSADEDIMVKRDLQSNTLISQPGEYFAVRQSDFFYQKKKNTPNYFSRINH
jgi:lipopolysaccharide biosynthesis glycosyltransferase